jgi:hypothetical protein
MTTPAFGSGTHEVPSSRSESKQMDTAETSLPTTCPPRPARCLDAQRAGRCDQDMVGITNSAPARMPVGQRLVIVFNRV